MCQRGNSVQLFSDKTGDYIRTFARFGMPVHADTVETRQSIGNNPQSFSRSRVGPEVQALQQALGNPSVTATMLELLNPSFDMTTVEKPVMPTVVKDVVEVADPVQAE